MAQKRACSADSKQGLLNGECVPVTMVRNERGIALIMALVLLALLTMLGTWALDTSSTDLKIAGNYRNAETAFSLADTAAAYAASPTMLTNACLTISACTSSIGGSTSYTIPSINISGNTASGTIEFLGKGPLPINGSIYDAQILGLTSSGTSQTSFSGLYFSVTTVGTGPNNAKAQIETTVAQVVSN
jgi:Tfp pilus assembly protein PilX